MSFFSDILATYDRFGTFLSSKNVFYKSESTYKSPIFSVYISLDPFFFAPAAPKIIYFLKTIPGHNKTNAHNFNIIASATHFLTVFSTTFEFIICKLSVHCKLKSMSLTLKEMFDSKMKTN